MRIGIISDTHGSVNDWVEALDLFEGVELIVHAGDVAALIPPLQRSGGIRAASHRGEQDMSWPRGA